jgi:hypothetical protein
MYVPESPDAKAGKGSLGHLGESDVHPPGRERSYQNSEERYPSHPRHESHIDLFARQPAVHNLLDRQGHDDSARSGKQGDGDGSEQPIPEFGGKA